MAAAWIGFAGGVLAAVVSVYVAMRQSRMAEEITRLRYQLDREQRAEEVLSRYREPLAAAAFDLQSRLYNILKLEFFDKFGDNERAEEALRTTLFRLAQYFGWTEILRRDIQFLSFPTDDETRRVAELQESIAQCFRNDDYGPELMIWSDEQRAIGELMIIEEHGKVLSMGYAAFRQRCDDTFAPWRIRMREELHSESAQARLRDIQHNLCDLVETLDFRRVRYTRTLKRA
jgi:hypothetical protein